MKFSICFSHTLNRLSFITVLLCTSPCIVICKPTVSTPPTLAPQNGPVVEKLTCATISTSRCSNSCVADSDCEQNCNINQNIKIAGYWSKKQVMKGFSFVNITNLKISNKKCQMTLCEDQDLMGYCAQVSFGMPDAQTMFGSILESNSLSLLCSCGDEGLNKTNEDTHFDKNYVGVVYSPYDKYWEHSGPNGSLSRVSWKNYSLNEITQSLRQISKKFTYISTYGMGTVSNTSEWNEGDKVAFVPKLAAEMNKEVGYPAIRVSVGIFRKDDVNVEWKNKELFNAITASKLANAIFNGTVWGIIVTSDYATDATKANDTIAMIIRVKDISERESLHLRVGIRLKSCSEFTATRRPEDDARVPAYQDPDSASKIPLTSFQSKLHKIANITDFLLCSYLPPPKYVQFPFQDMIKAMQEDFLQLREVLKKINPRVELVIETGVASQGIGNGFENSHKQLKEYWYAMADFARKEKMRFHMFEAVDQPWKNVLDSPNGAKRYDVNGPNGADAYYGWFKRVSNSETVYREKILDKDISDGTDSDGGGMWGLPAAVKFLILGFIGFVLVMIISTGYLCIKLRKAKRQVISPAYVEQFLSGGDASNTKDDNYAVALRIPYNRKYELQKDDFHIDKSAVMGSGQCGIVLKGTIKGRADAVAFKCTSPASTVVDVKSLMSEIKILSYIGEHNNILCILGAYTKKIERGIVYVALEYCPLGSLEGFLRKIDANYLENNMQENDPVTQYKMLGANGCLMSVVNPGYVTARTLDSDDNAGSSTPQSQQSQSSSSTPSSGYVSSFDVDLINDNLSHLAPKFPTRTNNVNQVDITTFYKWAYQIASAMEFVSEKNVTHADLAARNILLASVDQVKVCDFGLSRKLYQEMGVIHDKDTPLPWRWMAPESLKHLVFSVESDVWAYGVTLWEIFSLAEVPYHGITYDMKFSAELEKGMRLPKPKYASSEIHNQLENCWDITPNNRPSFTDLKDFFEDMLQHDATK